MNRTVESDLRRYQQTPERLVCEVLYFSVTFLAVFSVARP